MIDYFEQLIPEEQEGITEVIQTLFRQTFLLERCSDTALIRLPPVQTAPRKSPPHIQYNQ